MRRERVTSRCGPGGPQRRSLGAWGENEASTRPLCWMSYATGSGRPDLPRRPPMTSWKRPGWARAASTRRSATSTTSTCVSSPTTARTSSPRPASSCRAARKRCSPRRWRDSSATSSPSPTPSPVSRPTADASSPRSPRTAPVRTRRWHRRPAARSTISPAVLAAAIRDAQDAGEVADHVDSSALGYLLLSVIRGIDSIAKADVDAATLEQAARSAVALIPRADPPRAEV